MATVGRTTKQLATLYGSPDYATGLDRLMRKVQARGIKVESRYELIAYALSFLAANEGMKLPERAKPLGTNRYGMPKSAFEQ
jgi:hypothetical protein